MTIHSIAGADLTGQRVLVRVDFNVPLKEGKITDDSRIRASIPTIETILNKGGSVILVSHLGRPKGKVNEEMRITPAGQRLKELLGRPVMIVDDVTGPHAQRAAASLQPGQVLLLENVRFDPREEKNDASLAAELAGLADVYVNDAFGAAHRAHASTTGVTAYLPSHIGLLMLDELDHLGKLTGSPDHPFVAVLGGAKVTDKVGVITELMNRVDALLLGGGIANTFALASGLPIGDSLADRDFVPEARKILEKAAAQGISIHLPSDVVIAPSIDGDGRVVDAADVPEGQGIFDIGPETIEAYGAVLKNARTIFWNGPMGVFEKPAFARGTLGVAEAIAASDSYSVVGGGDSLAAIEQSGVGDRIDHLSTGGGASLEFLEGKVLPGVAALERHLARRPLIAGNWKMNASRSEALVLASALSDAELPTDVDVAIFPPFLWLEAVARALDASVHLGAQDCSAEVSGAFTGQVSARQIKELCNWVIVGHSERRRDACESDDLVGRKAAAAIAAGLTPIVCVGESLETREAGEAETFVGTQVDAIVRAIGDAEGASFVVAYEPIWAIGTGRSASDNDAQSMSAFIRGRLGRRGDSVRILYGGSVVPDNAGQYLAQPDVDGLLVGGASLKADQFLSIIAAC